MVSQHVQLLQTQDSATPHTGAVLDPISVLKSCGIRAGMRIADFGSGRGHFALPAAKMVGPRGSVYAVDLQKELVHALDSQAKFSGLENVSSVWADLEEYNTTKIPSNLLDVVLLISNHVSAEAQMKMMREAGRVLKKGALLIIVDWLPGNTIPFPQKSLTRIPKEVAIANAQTVGFQFVDEFRPGRYHYGLRFQKA
ncbi:MAG: class I SAM-dependent methyltransferase [Candidatus Magasanikbacteria bacterium]|nr:class I SAM-dependent methyltransferase [Candidatus Magasanikbacteria bacterium]